MRVEGEKRGHFVVALLLVGSLFVSFCWGILGAGFIRAMEKAASDS